VQLIISVVIPGTLYCTLHFSAVLALRSLSSATVAIRASQVAQFKPQHAISFSIVRNYVFHKYIRKIILNNTKQGKNNPCGVKLRIRILSLMHDLNLNALASLRLRGEKKQTIQE